MDLETALVGYNLYVYTAYAKATAMLYEQKMKKVLELMGNLEVEEITLNDLNKLMGHLRNEYIPFRFNQTNEPLSMSALANYWKSLRSFFKWAEEDMGIKRPDDKLLMPKYKLPEVKAFSHDELKRIFYCAEWTKNRSQIGSDKIYRTHRPSGTRDVVLLRVFLDTGMRIGEVGRIHVEDIDLETGEIVVRPFGSSKKSRPRIVYLGALSKKAVWVYIAKKKLKPSDSLFDLTQKRMYRIIYDIGKEAGVKDCHPHRFRHTFAIEFLRAQKDPYALQTLMGHSDMTTTRHYLDIVDADLRRIHGIASPVDRMKL